MIQITHGEDGTAFAGFYKTGGKLQEPVYNDIPLNNKDLLLLLKKKDREKCGEI